jgi:DnaJ-class molecular chaperone
MIETCQQCNGEGFEYEWDADEQRSIKEPCTACNGTGEVETEEEMEIAGL